MNRAPHVTYQFAGQRKAQEYILYPPQGGRVQFQSDKAIGQISLETGKGVYTSKGCYGPHLAMYGKVMEFPADFVQMVKDALPQAGTEIVMGGVVHVQY